MDIEGIPTRVVHWRKRRKLTQGDLAARLDRSLSWVKAFETGGRQADPRISVLELISQALAVPLEVLLGVDNDTEKECLDSSEIDDVRATLMRPDVIIGTIAGGPQTTLAKLKAQVAYGFEAYQAAHYSTLGRTLPDLITQAHSIVSENDKDTSAALSAVYHLTTLTLMRFSASDFAWQAAQRALTAGHTSGHPAMIGLAAQALTYAMSGKGEHRAGVTIATSTADAIEGQLREFGPQGWTVYGMLYLKAAVAAAAAQDSDSALDLLNEARSAAIRIGDRNDYSTGFGITNCLLHEAAVLGQLGEYGEALKASRLIDPGALAALPRERRAHHLIDTAIAYQRSRQTGKAIDTLAEAELLAAEEVHCRPGTRLLIEEMLDSLPERNQRLLLIAKRSGVNH